MISLASAHSRENTVRCFQQRSDRLKRKEKVGGRPPKARLLALLLVTFIGCIVGYSLACLYCSGGRCSPAGEALDSTLSFSSKKGVQNVFHACVSYEIQYVSSTHLGLSDTACVVSF